MPAAAGMKKRSEPQEATGSTEEGSPSHFLFQPRNLSAPPVSRAQPGGGGQTEMWFAGSQPHDQGAILEGWVWS